jgi:hypothetical protein
MSEQEEYQKYLADQKEKAEYDEYVKYLSESEQENKVSPIASMYPSEESLKKEAALRAGILSGATAGHAPQIEAGIKSLLGMVPRYSGERDKIIKENAALQTENPLRYGAGNLTGAIGTSPIPVGALAKAPLYVKSAAGAISSGLLSMLQNPGDEEGKVDPVQLSERLAATQNPGLIANFPYGGIIEGAALPAAPLMAKPIDDALNSRAARAAYKTLDPSIRVVKKQYKRAEDIGREMIDRGILDWFPSKEKMASRLANQKEITGQDLGGYIDELSPYSEKASREFDIMRRKKVPVSQPDSAPLDALGSREANKALSSAGTPEQIEYNRALSTDVDLPQLEYNRQVGEQIWSDTPVNKSSMTGAMSETAQEHPWRIVTEIEDDAGPAFSYVDEPIAKGAINTETRFGTSRNSIANRLRERLISKSSNDIDTVRKNNRAYERMSGNFRGSGNDILSLAESEAKKRDVQKMINFDRQNPASINQTNSAFNEAMRSELMRSGDSLSNYLEKLSGKNPGKFEKLKKSHGSMAAASDLAEEAVKKKVAGEMFDTADKTILGLTAAPFIADMFKSEDINGVRGEGDATSRVLLGLGALGAKKLGGRYGRQLQVKGLEGIRAPIEIGSEFIRNNPWSSQYILNTLQQDEQK